MVQSSMFEVKPVRAPRLPPLDPGLGRGLRIALFAVIAVQLVLAVVGLLIWIAAEKRVRILGFGLADLVPIARTVRSGTFGFTGIWVGLLAWWVAQTSAYVKQRSDTGFDRAASVTASLVVLPFVLTAVQFVPFGIAPYFTIPVLTLPFVFLAWRTTHELVWAAAQMDSTFTDVDMPPESRSAWLLWGFALCAAVVDASTKELVLSTACVFLYGFCGAAGSLQLARIVHYVTERCATPKRVAKTSVRPPASRPE